ncbi:hypothetical protein F2P81_019204 [Scophthalmus maximus]|uniref:Uncharacterized protein n=1 Tax=Scophthalmus maximus TaxID=52904 RepID=A0A6A4S4X6_SCOMX|nr:hypothetical protein F2P81_019204 [Scophthalmus maximus]
MFVPPRAELLRATCVQRRSFMSKLVGQTPVEHSPPSTTGGHLESTNTIGSPGSQLAHAGTSREDNWKKITVQAQSDGKYGNQAVDRQTAVCYPCFSKLPQFD